jgi:hypothetical protein
MRRRALFSLCDGAISNRAASPGRESLSQQAAIAYRQGRIGLAKNLYELALSADPGCPIAQGGLGWIQFIEHRRLQAARLLGRAYQLAPNDFATVRNYAAAASDPSLENVLLQRLINLPAAPPAERDKAQSRLARRQRLSGRLLNELLSDYSAYMLPMPVGPHGWTVRVRLNARRTLRLLVDTGARSLLLNRWQAEGLDLEPLGQSRIGGFGDGPDEASQVTLARTLECEGLRLAHVVVEVAAKQFVAGVDGVIGLDILRHFQVTLDGPRKQLRLTPYAEANASAAAGEHPWGHWNAPECPPAAHPFRRLGHLILVEDRSTPGQQWVLDSGASYSILHEDFPSGEAETIPLSGVSGAARPRRLPRPIRFHVGDSPAWTAGAVGLDLAACSAQLGIQVAGFLGFPALREKSWTIDQRDGWIRVQAGLNR